MDIHWFPGHMAKSRRELMANLGRADLILEICDARLPASSRHPDLAEFFAQKPVWTILSKADLSDPKQNESWLQYAEGRGEKWLFMDLYAPADLKKLRAELKEFNQQFVAAAKSKGKRISPLKLIVVGIPNTGKSTLINRLAGKKTALASNRPGVTRSLRWIRIGTEFEILDTPGILAPKLDTAEIKINLAATGAIPDDILPLEEVAYKLFAKLCQDYPQLMRNRYEADCQAEDQWARYQEAALNRNCVAKGGKADIDRFSKLFLQDFRNLRIGQISLEFPPDIKAKIV